MKSNIILNTLFIILCLIAILVKNIILDTLLIVLFLIYIFNIFNKHTRFFLANIFLLFSFAFNAVSLFLNEKYPIYLRELDITTYYKGVTPLFILSSFCIIQICKIVFKKFVKNKKKYIISKFNAKLIIFSYVVLYVVLFSQIFDKPEFVLNIGRTIYRTRYLTSNKFIYIVQGFFGLFPVMLGLIATRYKKTSFFLMILMFVYGLWIGEKFGFFMRTFSYYILMFSLLQEEETMEKLKKYVYIAGIIIVACFLINRIYVRDMDFTKSRDYFIQRVAQQNQLTWYFYQNDYKENNNVKNEVNSFFIPNKEIYNQTFEDASKYGQFKIMTLATGWDFAYLKFNRKSRLATGTIAQILLYTKSFIMVFIIQLILAISTQTHLKYIAKEAKSKERVFSFLKLNFMLKLQNVIVLGGMFQILNDLFNIQTLNLVFMIFGLEFLKQLNLGIFDGRKREEKQDYEYTC